MVQTRLLTACLALGLITSFLLPAKGFPAMQEIPEYKPPFLNLRQTDKRKSQIAKDLSSWTRRQLQGKKRDSAVLCRMGNRLTLWIDETGLSHCAIAVYEDESRDWITYNLLSDPATKRETFMIRRATLEDFFYGQRNYQRQAAILYPEPDTGHRLAGLLETGEYRNIIPGNRYHLVPDFKSPRSFNCTKWIAYLTAAAKGPLTDSEAIMAYLRENAPLETTRLKPWVSFLLRHKQDVRREELPRDGSLQTVTALTLLNAKTLYPEAVYHAPPAWLKTGKRS